MQDDEVNLLTALTCLLRTIKETDKLSSKNLEQWPVYSSTLQKLTEEDGQKDIYQLQKLKKTLQRLKLHLKVTTSTIVPK